METFLSTTHLISLSVGGIEIDLVSVLQGISPQEGSLDNCVG